MRLARLRASIGIFAAVLVGTIAVARGHNSMMIPIPRNGEFWEDVRMYSSVAWVGGWGMRKDKVLEEGEKEGNVTKGT
jgi:hypothetical protein